MKTLYLDCSMGAAGDMLAGALLELQPNPKAALAELNAFGIPGVVYRHERLAKCGIAATRLQVFVEGREERVPHPHGHGHAHGHAHRTLAEVLHLIGHLSLQPAVREDVVRIYDALAAAESRAHGRSVGEIHFHEVGMLDAIADIAACCHLLHRLAPDEVVASPVHVGSGTVACAHGILPVPAPATAFLLEGVPTYSDGNTAGELCTPTGAALLKRFAASFGPQPLMTVQAVGHGSGKKDFPRANVVRALLGERSKPAEETETVFELAFNVDDMTGEELAFASGQFFDAGAKDVTFTPVFMKKGRPGQRVSVLCAAAARETLLRVIFAHTSTLGIRETRCRRHTLARAIETVTLADGSAVRRKVASGYGVRRAKWEADDLAARARKTGATLSETKASLDLTTGERT